MNADRERLEIPASYDGAIWYYRNVGRRFPMHRHAELELNLTVRGRATCLVEDRKYILRRQTMAWLFPAQSHVLLDQSVDFEMWIFVWRPRLVRRVASGTLRKNDPHGEFCRRLGESPFRRLAGLFQEVRSAETDVARFNAGLAYALLTAWAGFCEADARAIGVEVHPAVESAARLLRDDPTLPLGDLAARAGLSESRLSRLFHDQTGVTLVDFRNRQRLDRFLALYGDGLRRTMMESALEAGFGSYPQFHRVFTRLIGCSPLAYRRKL